MQKGAPSVNPSGFSRAAIEKAKQATGSDGVVSFGGFLQTGESSSKLTGAQRWIEYANAFQRPPVAIAALLRSALLGGAKWTLTENDAGGKDARKGVDIVQRGLLDARMSKPWPVVVRKAAMSYFNGFSLHAAALGRRPDGLVVFTDIAHRPAHTAFQWLRKDSFSPFDTFVQRIQTGETTPIPLSECLHIVNDTLSDSPEGTGVLRLVVERVRRNGNYEAREGSEVFMSMGGMPIARVPLTEINHGAPTSSDADALAAYQLTKTSNITSIVSDRIKSPEKQMFAVLDSATYQGSDPNTISNIPKWNIEIVKGELQGLPEIRKIISDLDLDVARMLGVEFVFIGGNDGSGTFGMHESKISLFAATLSSDLVQIGDCATDQLARRLIAANGLDPDTATPRLVASPISTEDVEKTTRTLVQLNMAGLRPNHPAKVAIFERLNLPWEDEPDIGMPLDISPAADRARTRAMPVEEPPIGTVDPKPIEAPGEKPIAPTNPEPKP